MDDVYNVGAIKQRKRVDPNSPGYKIFYEHYPCVVKASATVLLDEKSEQPVFDDYPAIDSGLLAQRKVQVSYTPNPAEALMLERMHGRPAFSGTSEEIERQMVEKISRDLSIAKMAEIYDFKGYLRLKSPYNHAPIIRDILESYIKEVRNERHYHRKAPPEDDMVKLEALLTGIKMLETQINEVVDVGGDMSRFQLNSNTLSLAQQQRAKQRAKDRLKEHREHRMKGRSRPQPTRRPTVQRSRSVYATPADEVSDAPPTVRERKAKPVRGEHPDVSVRKARKVKDFQSPYTFNYED